LRKELRDILEEWIEAEGEARLARWLLEGRRTRDMEMNVASKEAERPRLPAPAPQMLLSFLPEQAESVGRSMTAGAAPLRGKDKGLGFAAMAVTGSPLLPAVQPEMHESSTPKTAKSRARNSAHPIQVELADDPHGPGDSTGPRSAQPHADASIDPGEAIPLRRSSAESSDAERDGCARPCNLHPAIRLRLVARRAGDDPFGEGDSAPPVALNSGGHPERPLSKSCAREKTEAPVRFRIHFGHRRAEDDEMAAAS